MFRKSLLTLVSLVGVLLVMQVAVFAQYAPVSGKVELLKADGTRQPVANAVVDVYRTDMKAGGSPSGKTDKKGEFSFAGMMLGAEYTFAVSAPGAAPTIFPNVKAGQDHLVITMNPGNGSKMTEAEVRSGAASAGGDQSSAEEKKLRAEYEAKNAEIAAKNKRTQEGDEIARKSNEEAQAAFKAANYDLAITKYNEGIAAVPDFVGSTPILLGGKMNSLKMKGYGAYLEGAKSTDKDIRKAKYEEATKSYDDALGAFQNAVDIFNKAEAATDPAEQKRRESFKLSLYTLAVELFRLKSVTRIDTARSADAGKVIAEYVNLETDSANKMKAQMTLGDIMRSSGDLDKAVAAYRQVLTASPDNADAIGKLGLSLFAQGAAMVPEDKEKEQEGLNLMQKYTEISPVTATDSAADKELKTSIKEAVDYLKSQNMAPKKPAATPKKRG
jgi:tetratricopeptide (TPR) repeat protein